MMHNWDSSDARRARRNATRPRAPITRAHASAIDTIAVRSEIGIIGLSLPIGIRRPRLC